MGRFRAPMLATPWPHAFDDDAWSFEPKWDGIRAVLAADGSEPRLYSRSGRDISGEFPALLGAAPPGAVLDGEIVAVDGAGKPSFQLLQQRGGTSTTARPEIHYLVFDVLAAGGREITSLGFDDRRARLDDLALGAGATVSDRLIGDGSALWVAIVAEDLEGVVAKLRTSPYRAGVRSPAWRKIVHRHTARVVVGGWLEGSEGRPVKSLLLGLWSDSTLRYVGSVGSGFDEASLRSIAGSFAQMSRPESPFDGGASLPAGSRFVEPVLVAHVEFRNWTEGGALRHPVFRGFGSEPSDEMTWAEEGPG
ncbi:MAG: non-homologous end-joining DNA ligase [Acidimicrobiia bacterium]|nr:non-homologous end-joining DNA ligase [Acidimicrobiia bacterium]